MEIIAAARENVKTTLERIEAHNRQDMKALDLMFR